MLATGCNSLSLFSPGGSSCTRAHHRGSYCLPRGDLRGRHAPRAHAPVRGPRWNSFHGTRVDNTHQRRWQYHKPLRITPVVTPLFSRVFAIPQATRPMQYGRGPSSPMPMPLGWWPSCLLPVGFAELGCGLGLGLGLGQRKWGRKSPPPAAGGRPAAAGS
jgi:hypothetical protein